MMRGDLVRAIASAAGISQKSAEAAMKAVTTAITKSLSKGQPVRLIGFGTFEVRRRAARKGVVPGTKREIRIPARKVPAFRAGAVLKAAVR